MSSSSTAPETSSEDTHDRAASSANLNRLRAGVLGANDGIVSVAGMVVGVAAATPTFGAFAIAGAAALSAGALSMAMGEYVSVSTQREPNVRSLSVSGSASPRTRNVNSPPSRPLSRRPGSPKTLRAKLPNA